MKIYKEKRFRAGRWIEYSLLKISTKVEFIEKYGEEEWRKQRKEGLKRQKEIRLKALRAYGDRCINCGITDERVLCIDHVIPIGKKRIPGPRFYYWLIKNNYPNGYQILCHNCNHLKAVINNEYKRD